MFSSPGRNIFCSICLKHKKQEVPMKLWKFSVMAMSAVLAIISCKAPVHVQKDESANLASYHTYTWVETKANENDGSARSMAYADQSVKKAVSDELSKQGWREVTDNPDVLVSYDVLVERTVEQQSNPVYTQPFTRVYYNPFRRRWGT